MRQSLVHRSKTISHADNSLAVAERLVKGLSQRQSNIFHRVMDINVQIAFRLDIEIEQSMHSKVSQHVVEKPNSCGNLMFACAVQIQFDGNLRFVRLS